MAHTIALLGQPKINEDGVATAVITPGMLVDGVTTVAPHAVVGGLCARAFALERDEMGKSITDDYAVGDTVKVGVFGKGDRVLALIASGQNIAENNQLESAGDGTLRILAAGVALARSLEAVDNSAGPANAAIRVEIL